MFRVVGRDARGTYREISVCASTEDEARAIVLGSGDIATIDRVTIPPPALPPRTLKLSRWTATILGCLLCLGSTTIGAVVGLWIGHDLDKSSHEFIRVRWLVGGMVGAILGVI